MFFKKDHLRKFEQKVTMQYLLNSMQQQGMKRRDFVGPEPKIKFEELVRIMADADTELVKK